MFENILGQADIQSRLVSDIGGGRLPGSVLFEGPPASAKLSTALELARVLSCERSGAWNCPCAQCARHRLLSHQDIMLMGPKSFREELAIGARMMRESPGTSSRYFFVRAAMKLVRRFDRELYADEEGRLAKALPLVRSVLEGVDKCLPAEASGKSGGQADDDAAAAKEAESLLAACAKLEDLVPDAVPVFQVRAMEFWARLQPYGKRKTIIIEHADRMLDASRNALLKILEEPPAHAVIVLTSDRPQAMIQTILSRVRRYRFARRAPEDARLVMERLFKDKGSTAASVEAYLAGYRPTQQGAMDGLARGFACAMADAMDKAGDGFSDPPLAALAAEGASNGLSVRAAIAEAAAKTSGFGQGDEAMAWAFPSFIEGAGLAFSALLRDGRAGEETLRVVELYAGLARDAMLRFGSYNLNPGALAERLAAAMCSSRAEKGRP